MARLELTGYISVFEDTEGSSGAGRNALKRLQSVLLISVLSLPAPSLDFMPPNFQRHANSNLVAESNDKSVVRTRRRPKCA